MSEHVRTTRETVELLIHTIAHGSRDELADLYAPDVVITNPFAADGVPAESRGNAQLRERMKAFAQLLSFDATKIVAVHETADPEVAIAEFTLIGTILASGTRFELAAIDVFRVVDGLITEARDYMDGVRAAKLLEEIGQ